MPPPTLLFVVCLAAAKVLIGVAVWLLGLIAGIEARDLPSWGAQVWNAAAIVIGFGGCGGVLLARRSGPAERWLGTLFLFVASSFTRVLIHNGAPVLSPLVISLIDNVRLDAAIPVAFWHFSCVFPQAGSEERPRGLAVEATAATWMVVVVACVSIVLDKPAWPMFYAAYWPLVMLSTLVCGAHLVRRAAVSQSPDRGRVLAFALAFVAGALPIALDIMVDALWPAWHASMVQAVGRSALTTVVLGALLTIPFTTAWTVLARLGSVSRVAGLIVYGLTAPTTLLLLVTVPLAVLARVFGSTPDAGPSLLLRPGALFAVVLSLVAGVAVSRRTQLLRVIDRWVVTPNAEIPGLTLRSRTDEPARECPTCGRVWSGSLIFCPCGDLLEESDVPRMLAGKYEVVSRLGRGGMGVVYQAEDADLKRKVAIKTLPAADSRQFPRLRREAQAMAQVSGTGLANIFGIETWRTRPFLVVELLERGTLAARLKQGPLALDEAIDIVAAVTRGLTTLHDAGLLHRDVKPSNIGFTASGEIKLLDFGLTREIDDEPSTMVEDAFRTETGVFAGSTGYLPPEAFNGGPVSVATDLWALAVVLLECLEGHNPLQGEHVGDTYGRVRGAAENRPWAHLPLASFFDQAFAADPADRPASAREFLAQLERLRASLAA